MGSGDVPKEQWEKGSRDRKALWHDISDRGIWSNWPDIIIAKGTWGNQMSPVGPGGKLATYKGCSAQEDILVDSYRKCINIHRTLSHAQAWSPCCPDFLQSLCRRTAPSSVASQGSCEQNWIFLNFPRLRSELGNITLKSLFWITWIIEQSRFMVWGLSRTENTGCPQLSQSLATWTRGKDLGKARVCSLEQYSAAVHQCTWSFCIKHSYCIESQLFFTKHYTFMIKMYNVSEEMSLGNPHHTEVLVLRSQHRKDVPPLHAQTAMWHFELGSEQFVKAPWHLVLTSDYLILAFKAAWVLYKSWDK